MLEFQLNEERVGNQTGDLNLRAKELQALNNSADEIVKKISREFNKDYDDVKKYLLPLDIKKYASMSSDELNNTAEHEIKKLKAKYLDLIPNASKLTKVSFIKKLINAAIERL
jgi:hypothetical protein